MKTVFSPHQTGEEWENGLLFIVSATECMFSSRCTAVRGGFVFVAVPVWHVVFYPEGSRAPMLTV